MVVSIKKNRVSYLGIGNLIVKRNYTEEGPTSHFKDLFTDTNIMFLRELILK